MNTLDSTTTAPPALLASPADFDRIREAANHPGLLRDLAAFVRHLADHELNEPVVTRDIQGRRLLHVSRRLLRRVINCGLAYQLDRDPRHARRVMLDLQAAAAFSDWNPSHVLDVAERCAAFALGLDWLGDAFTPDERRTIEDALIRLGLEPGLADPSAWYFSATNNWNAVCNGGLAMGAITVRHRRPDLAQALIARCIEQLPLHGENYAPEGAYTEGPMYWDYGTTFHVLAIESLLRATGSTHGLDALPGFRQSADYMVHVIGPTGEFYSYFDSGPSRLPLTALLWFGRHYNIPRFTRAEADNLRQILAAPTGSALGANSRYIALSLLWLKPEHFADAAPPKALAWSGAGPNPVAFWRSAWTPDATWVGAKGGKARVSHGHLDAGSFVFEAGGVRWAVDPGSEDYHRLESMGIDLWARDRWSIFRLGSEGHSIPRIDGVTPDPDGRCPRIHWTDTPAPRVSFDLGALYPGVVDRLHRTISDGAGGRTCWLDEVGGLAAGRIYRFTWITIADVIIGDRCVLLAQNGRQLRIDVDCNQAVTIGVIDPSTLLKPHDTPIPGLKRIEFALMAPGVDFTLQLTARLAPSPSFPLPCPTF
ncbi:MAG: heparinase [Rariglobus sp.]|nr:heparinase [Rariglobus sp.]